MRRFILLSSTLLVLAACSSADDGGITTTSSSSTAATSSIVSSSTSSISTDIEITEPHANALVTSPLIVKGQARGTWYFEASFPVKLLDGNETEITVVPAQALSDWMTPDFVPFSVALNFSKPATQNGTLVLQKDNPSGEPAHDASVRIPVRFW